MGWFGRIREAGNSLAEAVTAKALRSGSQRVVPKPGVLDSLAAATAGGGLGGWASDHASEARNVKGWNFCAVRAIARTCAKANPHFMAVGDRARKHLDAASKAYKRGKIPREVLETLKSSVVSGHTGDDAVPLPPTFALNRMLNRPNPWFSRAQLLFQLSQQLSVTGTALLWTRRNRFRREEATEGRGTPMQMFVIPTGLTFPQPPSLQYPEGSYRVMPVGAFGGSRFFQEAGADDGFQDYAWTNLMLIGGEVDAREVRPIRWPHPLFMTDGLSAESAGDMWIDIATQLDKATWFGFKHTLRPSYIFKQTDQNVTPTDAEMKRFEKEVAARMSGTENTNRSMTLPAGIEIADASHGVSELDYIAGREAIGHNILSLHACPPIAIGSQQPGAYAAYYAAMIQFSEQAIEPQLTLIADEIENELAPSHGDDLELHCAAPPINDKEQREAELALDTQAHARSINEYRKERRLPPWPEPFGKLPLGVDVCPYLHLLSPDLTRDMNVKPGGSDDPNGPMAPSQGVALAPGGGGPNNGPKKKPGEPPPSGNGNPAARNKPAPRLGKGVPVGPAVARKAAARFEVPGFFRAAAPVMAYDKLLAGLNGNGKHEAT